MRSKIILAAGAALALSMTVAAQAQTERPGQQPKSPQAQQSQDPSGAPMVRSVNVIDVSELPPEAKTQVDAAAAKASPDDIKGLRTSIDNSPEITKALVAKGAKSSDVIVANLDQQGQLTLVTKKRG